MAGRTGGKQERVRYNLDINFSVEAEKDAIVQRLKSVRALISGGEGAKSVDNFGLMSVILGKNPPQASSPGIRRENTQSFMRNEGKYSTVF